MKILAIETSCDETAIAVVRGRGGQRAPKFKVLAQIISSQAALHAAWGGVVPNLAKREHEKNLPPVLAATLKQANLLPPYSAINAVAVTRGPGLEPALWAGLNFAKALALAWGKPLIPVNHLEGHIYSVLVDQKQKLRFPALALIVSGGHTELVLVRDWLKYKIIGRTRDDAVGEAFDKVARLLDLPYPGGPALAKLAKKTTGSAPTPLPRPMLHSKDFDFSFSGLKTAVLYQLRDLKNGNKLTSTVKAAIANEFQTSAIDVLLAKLENAAKKYRPQSIIVTGGVSANEELRRRARQTFPEILLPPPELTGDNAVMIALAGYLRADLPLPAVSRLRADGNLVLK
ncbi:MAG: tRNA (adenosine(37)-N6)-threonylcarbamoyltransferase complex transferase subunit TsaD [Patescibacteria group bacterium]